MRNWINSQFVNPSRTLEAKQTATFVDYSDRKLIIDVCELSQSFNNIAWIWIQRSLMHRIIVDEASDEYL